MADSKPRRGRPRGGFKLNPADAERLIANIREIARHRMPDARFNAAELSRIFDLGIAAYEEETHSERMDVAVMRYLQTKINLRPSSLVECRSVLNRLLREVEGLGERTVRSMQARDCMETITRVYHTPHTIDKARRLLNCFFNYAIQQNWCRENPMRRMRVLRRVENTIAVLTLPQVHALLSAATRPEYRCCAAAVGIMLWAGVRPAEMGRLRWADVDLEEGAITIAPVVSKTGGARVVTIQPVLLRWLKRWQAAGSAGNARAEVVPRSWVKRWRQLRREAGLHSWRPDTLRHTFASYYLRHFRDLAQLQVEMGHSSARLLFGRYLNQSGITRESAASFWGCRSTTGSRRIRQRRGRQDSSRSNPKPEEMPEALISDAQPDVER